MQGSDTQLDDRVQREASTWRAVEMIPDNQPVLIYIPADRLGGHAGEDG